MHFAIALWIYYVAGVVFALFVLGFLILTVRGSRMARSDEFASKYHIPPGIQKARHKHWMYDEPE